jgi:hypothetical protein
MSHSTIANRSSLCSLCAFPTCPTGSRAAPPRRSRPPATTLRISTNTSRPRQPSDPPRCRRRPTTARLRLPHCHPLRPRRCTPSLHALSRNSSSNSSLGALLASPRVPCSAQGPRVARPNHAIGSPAAPFSPGPAEVRLVAQCRPASHAHRPSLLGREHQCRGAHLSSTPRRAHSHARRGTDQGIHTWVSASCPFHTWTLVRHACVYMHMFTHSTGPSASLQGPQFLGTATPESPLRKRPDPAAPSPEKVGLSVTFRLSVHLTQPRTETLHHGRPQCASARCRAGAVSAVRVLLVYAEHHFGEQCGPSCCCNSIIRFRCWCRCWCRRRHRGASSTTVLATARLTARTPAVCCRPATRRQQRRRRRR